jgi:hypothetical protein
MPKLLTNFMLIGYVEKIYGKGPKDITDSTGVEEYLKFDSSSKSFKNLPVRSLSSAVDAVILDVNKIRLKKAVS